MEKDKCYIYCLHQPEKIDSVLSQFFLEKLPKDMEEDIKAFKHWRSAQSSMLGKLLIRYAFQKNEIPFLLEDIKFTEKERPFVGGMVDFNLSHSGDYVLLAITKSGKVGIDIEKHRPISYSLFQKYFDEQEWLEINQSSSPNSSFFRLWSIKESAIKCDGRGVEVLSKTHKQYDSDAVVCDGQLLHYSMLDVDSDYSAAVACTQPLSLEIYHLSVNDLQYQF